MLQTNVTVSYESSLVRQSPMRFAADFTLFKLSQSILLKMNLA